MLKRAAVPGSVAAVRLLLATAVRVDARRAVLVILVSPLVNVVAAAQAVGLRLMIDGAVARNLVASLGGAVLLVAVTVGVHQLSAVTTDMRQVLQQRIGLEFDRQLMDLSAGRVHIDHYQDPEYLDMAELIRQRRGEFGMAFAALVETASLLARFAGAIALLVLAGPALALLPVCLVPLVLATRWQNRQVAAAEGAGAEQDRRRGALFALATDPVAAREVRVYRLSDEIAGRHLRAFTAASGPREAARLRGAVAVAAGWLVFCAALVGGLFLVTRSATGTTSAGQAVLVVLLGTRLVGATTGLGWVLSYFRRGLDTMALYLRLAGYPRDDPPAGELAAQPPCGDLVLDGVCFTYPGQPGQALGPVHLRLPAGRTVAVVGDNGAGKSTLVALLAGLYRPSAGRITVGGTDLATVHPTVWRSTVSAAFQDFYRFELLAREAVGVGDLDAIDDDDAVSAALNTAGAAELVAALPAGLDTRLGRTFPEGTDLSAGQWQKLALARARMRATPYLILLDEPTASLDPDSEADLLRRYLATAGPGTAITVIVSHRFSTVRNADLIVVLDRGLVVETGRHLELIARGGRYADLYALHAAAYAEPPGDLSARAEAGRQVPA